MDRSGRGGFTWPGENVCVRIIELIQNFGIGVASPHQIRREGKARADVRRYEALLACIMRESWRAWSKPPSGNRIRMQPLNPAAFGDHARQS